MHVLLLAAFAVLAQRHDPGAPLAAQTPQATPEDHAAIHKEMDQLFKSIELRQREIDRLLYDAGTLRAPKAAGAVAGVGAVLTRAKTGSQRVTRDIDRIFELIASHSHKGGGT